MERDVVIQNTSKALFVIGLGASFFSITVGGVVLLAAVGLYIYRPF